MVRLFGRGVGIRSALLCKAVPFGMTVAWCCRRAELANAAALMDEAGVKGTSSSLAAGTRYFYNYEK